MTVEPSWRRWIVCGLIVSAASMAVACDGRKQESVAIGQPKSDSQKAIANASIGNCRSFLDQKLDRDRIGQGNELNSASHPALLKLYRSTEWDAGGLRSGKWVGAVWNTTANPSKVFEGLVSDTACILMVQRSTDTAEAYLFSKDDSSNSQGKRLRYAQICEHDPLEAVTDMENLAPGWGVMDTKVCPKSSTVIASAVVMIGGPRTVSAVLRAQKDRVWSQEDLTAEFIKKLTAAELEEEKRIVVQSRDSAMSALKTQLSAAINEVKAAILAEGAWYPCEKPAHCCKGGSYFTPS